MNHEMSISLQFSYLCTMLNKCIRFSILLAVLVSAFSGNSYATNSARSCPERNETIKSILLSETKGIIESVPEIGNGGSFQQTIFKLKNSFGNNPSFSSKHNITAALIEQMYLCSTERSVCSIYMFNCCMLI
jgi:hypothetical protein